MTKIYFDEDSDVPKLFFSAVRPCTEQEIMTVASKLKSPETKSAITMTIKSDEADGKPTLPAPSAEDGDDEPKEPYATEPEKPTKKRGRPKKEVKEEVEEPVKFSGSDEDNEDGEDDETSLEDMYKSLVDDEDDD